ncbi:uncharacterized protein METZ01_LOCUS51057 [marine metagenome]|uniref:Uncharacterized protein n=1 Tax=marine metagenome TaxID=408172 RepID=A0A381SAQ1_9ZZZZ
MFLACEVDDCSIRRAWALRSWPTWASGASV